MFDDRKLVKRRKSFIEKSNKQKIKKLFYGNNKSSVGDFSSNYASVGGNVKDDGKKKEGRLVMPLKE